MSLRLLKCEAQRGHVNCFDKGQNVPPNPDIAGIGVIVGFLSTTSLAFFVSLSVIFLDHYEEIINFFRKYVTKNKEIYQHDMDEAYWRSPAFWFRVLSKNLLALSDTQLLTGLAVQFAALLEHCDLTIYHIQIVTHLAVLTTVTHLLTVVTLRNYFVKYKWINLPRVLFMLGNLGLLGYTSFISYNFGLAHRGQGNSLPDLDQSMSLACFFQRDRPKVHNAFGGKWASLLIGAIGGHVAVILAMYVLEDDENDEGDGHNTKKNTSRWSWLKWIGALFRNWIVAPIYAIYGMYMAGSELKHTKALGDPNVRMDEDDETQWGFSQFLPVLLLALPVFAGWESFWEEKDDDREHRFTARSHRGSQGGSRSALNILEVQKESKPHQGSPDASLEERRIESSPRQRSLSQASISSLGMPLQGTTSHISISPLPTPQFPSPLQTPQVEMSSPHLAVPSPAASPGVAGPAGNSTAVARSRSPSTSRFEEQLPR